MIPEPPIDLLQFLPEIVLTVTAILIMIADFFVPRQRERFRILGAAGALIALWLSWTSLERMWTTREAFFEGAIVIDLWTNLARVAALLIASVVLLIRPREKQTGDYPILILLSTVGATTMAASQDFLITVIGLEIMSLAIYPLVAGSRTRSSYEASVKYFLMGAVASAVMLFGLSFIFGETGTTRYFAIGQAEGHKLLGLLLFFSGFFFKIAAVPFHGWLPDVYQTSPAPLGAFMAAAVKLAAFAGLGRLLLYSTPLSPKIAQLFIVLSVFTMLLGNTGALFQSSLARLIGYSAIAHTGFLLMGAAATAQIGDATGLFAIMFYLVTYAPAAIAAFIVIGMMGIRDVENLRGLFAKNPLVAICLTLAMASLAGLPPTAGFWAKYTIFLSSYSAGHIGLLIVAVLNSLVAAYYYFRVVRAAFSEGENDFERSKVNELLLAAMAVVIIVIGLIPDAFMVLG